MKKILIALAALTALTFIGCEGDTHVDNNVTIIVPESNVTVMYPELPVLPIPETNITEPNPNLSKYGSGTVLDPFVFYSNGTYGIYEDTFFITNPVTQDCNLTVRPLFTDSVFDVILYDDIYTNVPNNNFIDSWDFTIPDGGIYTINIKSYEAGDVVLSTDCW